MKEKILQLLKTKFEGVSETTLSRMAEKASRTATTEELATTYVDGVNFQSIIESEADYRATKATQTSIDNYEKKYNIKEGKSIIPAEKKEDGDDTPPAKKDENTPEWAKVLLDFAKTYGDDKKATAAKIAKERLVSKIIELGASEKDKESISSLVDISSVTGEDDIEAKATSILNAYNAFKKPTKSDTPAIPDDDVAADDFAKLLEAAKEES